MKGDVFLDTNVLIYALSLGHPNAARAETLLAAGGVVSVQVLNEFADVARRKLGMTWEEVAQALADVRRLVRRVVPLGLAEHDAAMRIAQETGYRFYDALIVAAAQLSGCAVLWSEDMQDGRVVVPGLTIRNPFAAIP
jgi:predicted nucleic acid-binding protein